MSATIDIIQAEGLPPGKMSVFITIRVTAAICPRATPCQPDMDTVHRPPVSEASRGSLLVSKPGSFLRSAEAAPGALNSSATEKGRGGGQGFSEFPTVTVPVANLDKLLPHRRALANS